jgi:hypothetical protein
MFEMIQLYIPGLCRPVGFCPASPVGRAICIILEHITGERLGFHFTA